MRIGLLIYGSLDTLSGGYLYDRLLVEYLRQHGEQVEIVSIPWRNYLHHLVDNFSTDLQRHLESLPLDVLIQDELNHPSLFLLNHRLRKNVPYPILSIVHHLRSSEARPAWQNLFYRWVERRYLNTLDGLIYNSRTTRAEVESVNSAAERLPSVVAPPGGDRFQPEITADEITARAQEPGPLRILFLGNLIPRKALHVLLEALQTLPPQIWTLTVIGDTQVDPGYTESLRRQVTELGFENQVQFCGKLSDPELTDHLRMHHLLVVPSSYEGYGIVYIEAMGFGLPAIATYSGAADEIITSGVDGFLIETGDAAALAGHLKELNQDRRRLAEMSLAARRRYEAHPTWDGSMERIHRFLLEQVD